MMGQGRNPDDLLPSGVASAWGEISSWAERPRTALFLE